MLHVSGRGNLAWSYISIQKFTDLSFAFYKKYFRYVSCVAVCYASLFYLYISKQCMC